MTEICAGALGRIISSRPALKYQPSIERDRKMDLNKLISDIEQTKATVSTELSKIITITELLKPGLPQDKVEFLMVIRASTEKISQVLFDSKLIGK